MPSDANVPRDPLKTNGMPVLDGLIVRHDNLVGNTSKAAGCPFTNQRSEANLRVAEDHPVTRFWCASDVADGIENPVQFRSR